MPKIKVAIVGPYGVYNAATHEFVQGVSFDSYYKAVAKAQEMNVQEGLVPEAEMFIAAELPKPTTPAEVPSASIEEIENKLLDAYEKGEINEEQLRSRMERLKTASLNPVTMKEEYSKELLVSEAAMLMERLTSSWPDLVIDDISQTMVRAYEYKNGKVHTGEVRWHITVGSVMMGVARQVEITMLVKNGYLETPQTGRTPHGEEVRLEPIAFSNWCRLGVK